jgi:protein phosphatase
LTHNGLDERSIESKIQYLEEASPGKGLLERRIGFSTNVGRLREIDEDSIVAVEVSSVYESKTRKRILLLVADGLGGQAKGEVASSIGASIAASRVLGILAARDEIKSSTYHKVFSEAISQANKEILNWGLDKPQFSGMGTTLSLVVIDGNSLHLAHVGDSRVYILNQETIKQVTKDHSYVQELVDLGKITVEQAKNHPRKNIVTKVLGYYGEIQPDLVSLPLSDNEHVLVCCDGLTIHVGDEEIRKIVLRNRDPQKACNELVSLANEAGGTDNISVALASAKEFTPSLLGNLR